MILLPRALFTACTLKGGAAVAVAAAAMHPNSLGACAPKLLRAPEGRYLQQDPVHDEAEADDEERVGRVDAAVLVCHGQVRRPGVSCPSLP